MFSQERFATANPNFDRGIGEPARAFDPGRIIHVTEQMRRLDAEQQRLRAKPNPDWEFKPSPPERSAALLRPQAVLAADGARLRSPRVLGEARACVHREGSACAPKSCVDCGKTCGYNSRALRCTACENARRRHPRKQCVTCAKNLPLRNMSGKCRGCKGLHHRCIECGAAARGAVRCLTCYRARKTRPRGSCKVCSVRLNRNNQSGMCRLCRPSAPLAAGGLSARLVPKSCRICKQPTPGVKAKLCAACLLARRQDLGARSSLVRRDKAAPQQVAA